MDLSFSAEYEKFREQVRAFLAENWSAEDAAVEPPADERNALGGPIRVDPRATEFRRKACERGYLYPHVPKRYGGGEKSPDPLAQTIIADEFRKTKAPHEMIGQGPSMLVPTLIEHGTEEQKKQFVEGTILGKIKWCQGYSEPGSGSDLASLTTKAELIDEHFLVNGTKVWQTWAHHADWMFTLVRTDPEAKPKHAGISFLLIDLRTKGVKTKPILNIAGDDEFSQVLLDDVVVPKENLIGPLNGGWKVANDLLANERLFTSSPQHALEVVHRITRLANANGRDGDPVFRDKLAALRIRIIAQEALFWQAAGLIANGRPLGPASSTMKLIATSNLQAATDLLIDVADTHGADVGRQSVGDDDVDITRIFLQSRRATIYGGSSEIQRNVLARRVLGLPS